MDKRVREYYICVPERLRNTQPKSVISTIANAMVKITTVNYTSIFHSNVVDTCIANVAAVREPLKPSTLAARLVIGTMPDDLTQWPGGGFTPGGSCNALQVQYWGLLSQPVFPAEERLITKLPLVIARDHRFDEAITIVRGRTPNLLVEEPEYRLLHALRAVLHPVQMATREAYVAPDENIFLTQCVAGALSMAA